MANFVQCYSSYDTGCPLLSGTAGSLITVLNKCLVDGYTPASIASLTRVGSTVTATFAVGNPTFLSGQYITISGASPVDYNGTFQISAATNAGFTYQVVTTPTTPATGTILYAKAGLGWTRPFATGVNSQTYRSADSSSNQFYLQVIDNAATGGGGREAQIYGAEVMTADQSVSVNRFPTAIQFANGLCVLKSQTADATSRQWALYGDDKTFYLCTMSNITTLTYGISGNSGIYGFGHLISCKPGDAYNTFISGETVFPAASATSRGNNGLGYAMAYGSTTYPIDGMYLARSYTQTGSAVRTNIMTHGQLGSPGSQSSGLLPYPNQPDTGSYFIPITNWEISLGNPQFRGRFPGLYSSIYSSWSYHSYFDRITLNNPTTINLQAQFTSTQYSTISSAYYGMIWFDMFGPWN